MSEWRLSVSCLDWNQCVYVVQVDSAHWQPAAVAAVAAEVTRVSHPVTRSLTDIATDGVHSIPPGGNTSKTVVNF